jgi:hypothetical protein
MAFHADVDIFQHYTFFSEIPSNSNKSLDFFRIYFSIIYDVYALLLSETKRKIKFMKVLN